MCKLYLIGGGPGAGKSTVSQKIADEFGLVRWKADDFVGEHQLEAAERKYPINNYVDSLDENEQSLELIKLTSKQELTRQEELFLIMLKELSRARPDKLLIEGNFLLPELVKKHIKDDYEAIWLVPTRGFQEKLYPKRPWAPKLLKQDTNPELTLEAWIQRDHEYNEEVKRQAEVHGFPYLIVDGNKSVDYTHEWVVEKLHLHKDAVEVTR